jgi:hypothetical protein
MKINREITRRAIKKAKKSTCHTKVSALAFNGKGELVMKAVNRPRFSKEGGGVHAEMRILLKRPKIKIIVLCRTNNQGKIMPLDPCAACAAKARELGVKIIPVRNWA